MAAHPLEPVIHPQSIAIIGASKDPAKRGFRAIRSLLQEGYKGSIFPINLKEKEILGLKCYPNVSAAPQRIDLALVCTPAATTPDVIEACGKAGVRGAVLLAGGFSEASEEGRILEERTVEVARQYGVRLIGPNTSGMFSARLGCNALGTLNLPRGSIAILSNSANVMASLQNEFMFHGDSGISVMMSVGNQADIRYDEYLELLAEDPETKAIIFYVEGFKNAPAFLESARRVSLRKPIVMYIAGRNAAGKSAAKSHSGSLAGDFTVSKGVLRQAGVVMVTRSDELFPVAEALASLPPMAGRRVAILSEGGGPITIASEACFDSSLELATLSDAARAIIHEVVPAATAISNPVDAGGGTDPRAYYFEPIARAILADPSIDALLITGLFGGYGVRWGDEAGEAEVKVCTALGEMMRASGKPIVVQSHFAHMKTRSLQVLREAGIPYQRHIETAVQCLSSAASLAEARQRIGKAQVDSVSAVPEVSELISAALNEGRDLLEPEAYQVLQAYGVPVPEHVVVSSSSEVPRRLAEGPLAVKVVSRDILHKSDVGGVELGARGVEGVSQAIEQIRSSVARTVPDARVTGYLVTPMAARGTELIIGVLNDVSYGRLIMFGVGGVFVEVIRDVGFRTLPLSRADAWDMVNGLKHPEMLDGVRGGPRVNRESVVDLLIRISEVAQAHPEIIEIDLNPILANERGCTIVDARMVLTSETQSDKNFH
jgi:acetyltransferase